METDQAVLMLAALAQEARLRIFRVLVEAGAQGLPAGKIGEAVGVAPSSVSFHMKALTHAGLASLRNEGRFVIYTADFTAMNALLAFLTERCCGGKGC